MLERRRGRHKKTLLFFIPFVALVFVLAMVVFAHRFVLFAITISSLIIIMESVKKVLFYHSVKQWREVQLEDIEFDIINESSFNKKGRLDLYSLHATYTYKNKGKTYCSSQIYIDEPRDKRIFQSESPHAVNRWIETNKNIQYAYVNTKNPSQAVLFKEISMSSYLGKIFIALGAMLMIQVANNNTDWAFYFG